MSRPRTVEDAVLLPKAMYVFWRYGYANTGVRELEQELGIKAPSLYHRFGSKQTLFVAALQHYIEVVVRSRVERHLHATDPLPGLREFFDTTYNYTKHGQSALSCLLLNTALEQNASDRRVAELLKRGSATIVNALEQTLLRAQQQGSLRDDADPKALAEALYLGLQGLLINGKTERDKAVLKRRTDALFALLPLTTAGKPQE
jgi:TetR/AcrR family transcriptional repressor of nem operon